MVKNNSCRMTSVTPSLSNIFLEQIICSMDGKTYLRCADDIDILAEEEQEQEALHKI